MTPPLTGAQRNIAPAPPAQRNRWDCRTCRAHGYAQNAHAAYLAGTRHFEDEHDTVPTEQETPA